MELLEAVNYFCKNDLLQTFDWVLNMSLIYEDFLYRKINQCSLVFIFFNNVCLWKLKFDTGVNNPESFNLSHEFTVLEIYQTISNCSNVKFIKVSCNSPTFCETVTWNCDEIYTATFWYSTTNFQIRKFIIFEIL